ncbi:RsmB/NOP family class I SAM-dependent RNA methyltransferase [Chromobacterium sp. S0633]|nr:RsmB/NOP family class I SAM-dependent RNA methyltransferase [Chromobacterium sp. S0633]MCP1289443.1 RsmB/NOP family class I SAM-dependent RNA methyltransferase [Chromobacterium sp. S0633]
MTINHHQLKHIETVIGQMIRFDRPADAVLSAYFREHSKLGANDRHIIAETAFGALRRLLQLRALITPDKATPRRLALVALLKIHRLNVKELGDAASAGEKEWLGQIKGKALPASLEVDAELPQWVIERLGEQTPEQVIALGKGLAEGAPLDLRVNTMKMKRDELLGRLQADGLECEATPYSPLGIRLKTKPSLAKHELFKAGVFEVQDEGSQLLGLITGARRGEMVVDFCAGAGGKTLLLGAQMASSGRLYAFDVSEKRLAKLKPRQARSGLSNVHPQLLASENDTKVKRLAGKADRVLVDAPCSGLGTLRRNPDLKFRQSPESVAELNAKQASILASAARLVRAGGRLVYATCSLLPQENQDIVAAFLADHPEFKLVKMDEVLAEQKISLQMGDYLELKPQLHNTDGFFAAVLEKNA